MHRRIELGRSASFKYFRRRLASSAVNRTVLRHSLLKAVENKTTFIGKRRDALASQRMRSFKELLKHYRNLYLEQVKERFRI